MTHILYTIILAAATLCKIIICYHASIGHISFNRFKGLHIAPRFLLLFFLQYMHKARLIKKLKTRKLILSEK